MFRFSTRTYIVIYLAKVKKSDSSQVFTVSDSCRSSIRYAISIYTEDKAFLYSSTRIKNGN